MENSDIVGVWQINAPDAPFAWHMMTFTPFGTMLQGNPPAGNTAESDSSGHGIWRKTKTGFEAKFVEIKADHKTGEYIGKGIITLQMQADGGSIKGESEAVNYDAQNNVISGPHPSPIFGTKLTF